LTDGAGCAFAVINLPIVPAKIKLGNVPMEMLAADVVERPVDAALEQRERRFDSVAMNPARTRVLAYAVIGHIVFGKWASDHMTSIDNRTVCHEMRISRDILLQDACEIVGRNIGGYERPNVAVSLDKRHDRSFTSLQPALNWTFALLLIARLSADISFVRFDSPA